MKKRVKRVMRGLAIPVVCMGGIITDALVAKKVENKIQKQREDLFEIVKSTYEYQDSYKSALEAANQKLADLTKEMFEVYKMHMREEIDDAKFYELKQENEKERLRIERQIEFINSDEYTETVLKYFSFDEVEKYYRDTEKKLAENQENSMIIGGMIGGIGVAAAMSFACRLREQESEDEPEC